VDGRVRAHTSLLSGPPDLAAPRADAVRTGQKLEWGVAELGDVASSLRVARCLIFPLPNDWPNLCRSKSRRRRSKSLGGERLGPSLSDRPAPLQAVSDVAVRAHGLFRRTLVTDPPTSLAQRLSRHPSDTAELAPTVHRRQMGLQQQPTTNRTACYPSRDQEDHPAPGQREPTMGPPANPRGTSQTRPPHQCLHRLGHPAHRRHRPSTPPSRRLRLLSTVHPQS
jgi:hypothetical protein